MYIVQLFIHRFYYRRRSRCSRLGRLGHHARVERTETRNQRIRCRRRGASRLRDCAIGEYERTHGLDNWHGARHDARIVPPFGRQHRVFACCKKEKEKTSAIT